MNPNPYRKIYRTRTERIILNSYRVQQTRLEKEYAANCIETASNVHRSDVGDEVLQPEEPVEGNTRDPAHICAVAVPMEPDENRVIARLEKV